MAKVTKFEELKCWKASRILVNYVFDLFELPELKTDYTLKNQLERAALSVMNNIAEGFGRYHRPEFIRFLNLSASSCCEVKSMSYILHDRKKIDNSTLNIFQTKIEKPYALTLGLIRYLKEKEVVKKNEKKEDVLVSSSKKTKTKTSKAAKRNSPSKNSNT